MARAPMHISTKKIAIDKANTTVVAVVAVATFIIVFSLVASKALLEQRSYQARVITAKQSTLAQLKKNVQEVEGLTAAYEEFEDSSQNVLGGAANGQADRDGPNSRIVLDALPSKYDFPALTTSIDKLVTGNGFQLSSISGTDDEVNQAANDTSSSPTAIEIPFTLEANVAATDTKRFMELFERSIRPIQIQKLSISGQDTQLKLSITAKTYFQPGKNLNLRDEVVK